MTQTLKVVGGAVMMAVAFDLFILLSSLAQIGIEGRTGEWNSFWRWQAEQVVGIIK